MKEEIVESRLECVVEGQVQGVFYRDTAQQKALQLGLVGFAKNISDGTVFVLAEGAEEKLSEFLAFLYEGSPTSKVENVSVEWKEAEGNFKEFEIS